MDTSIWIAIIGTVGVVITTVGSVTAAYISLGNRKEIKHTKEIVDGAKASSDAVRKDMVVMTDRFDGRVEKLLIEATAVGQQIQKEISEDVARRVAEALAKVTASDKAIALEKAHTETAEALEKTEADTATALAKSDQDVAAAEARDPKEAM